MGGTRLWGYVLGSILLVADCVFVFLGSGPFSPQSSGALYFWMAVAGGPACLVVGLLAAPKWERFAGAFLWLGASVIALSISLQSGPHVGRYFLGLAAFVLPQALAASLFLIHGRQPAEAKRTRAG